MQQYPEYDIIKPKDAFVSVDNKGYKVATNRFHAQAVIRKSYMDKTQYPLISIGEDNIFERTANIKIIDMFPSFWSILRWGIKDIYHISQVPSGLEKKSWDNALETSRNQLSGEVNYPQINSWASNFLGIDLPLSAEVIPSIGDL